MPAEVRRHKKAAVETGTEFEVTANEQGQMIVPPLGAVYAELQAGPGVTTDLLDRFLSATGIEVDWLPAEGIWRAAGTASAAYAVRRRGSGGGLPRRVLADFIIGAHAAVVRAQLVTLEAGHFQAHFPEPRVLSPT